MARIAGVNIPQNKVVHVGLTYIHGVGKKFSNDICTKLNIPKKEILDKYFDKEYFCYMTVFIAGMQLLGDIDKKISILSSDFLSKKKETTHLLNDIEKNKVNILVGTQLISKGFNFPKLNCIVVVDADFSGMGFDLRSNEKNIQLYNQLSGRAGRFSKDSHIIYQTFDPLDKTLNSLLENKQENFFEEEIYLREQKNLPPFSRLIAFIISAKNERESYLEALKIKKSLSLLNLSLIHI